LSWPFEHLPIHKHKPTPHKPTNIAEKQQQQKNTHRGVVRHKNEAGLDDDNTKIECKYNKKE